MTPSGLGKTINIETANTLRIFQSYFGPYPYKTLSVASISGTYGQGWPGFSTLAGSLFSMPHSGMKSDSRIRLRFPIFSVLTRVLTSGGAIASAGKATMTSGFRKALRSFPGFFTSNIARA